MTSEVTISIEEYAKLVTELKSYQIGFTITISLLACIVTALLMFLAFKLLIYRD